MKDNRKNRKKLKLAWIKRAKVLADTGLVVKAKFKSVFIKKGNPHVTIMMTPRMVPKYIEIDFVITPESAHIFEQK